MKLKPEMENCKDSSHISEDNSVKNKELIKEKEDKISLISKSVKVENLIDKDSEENCNNIIDEYFKIKECSMIKYGIKPSNKKIKYGYCHTCDLNLMYPICSKCLFECHKKYEHNILEVNTPDYIICGCGERLHKFKNLERKNHITIDECPYSDWCKKSGLSSLYVIQGICVCEFCYRICGYEGQGKQLEKEKEMLQACECERLNGIKTHTDFKHIFRALLNLIGNKDELIMGIQPYKFLNLLFFGKSSYEAILFNFAEMFQRFEVLSKDNKLKLKDNFISTNFSLSLTIFMEIVNKNKGISLSYFYKELVEKFSFDLIKRIIQNIEFKDNLIFWYFLSNMLFLYKKINMGNKSLDLEKYKIEDLGNFSPLLRKAIFFDNIKKYPEAHEQIEFFITTLNEFLSQDINDERVVDFEFEICNIIKRFSKLYLFSNIHMIRFCLAIEKIFNFSKMISSHEKLIKLFLILSKTFIHFIYCYNDNSIFEYVMNETNGSNDLKFIFDKNELGRLICRNVIRMMYFSFILKNFNKLSEREILNCNEIIKYGIQIIELMFSDSESYFMQYNNQDQFPEYEFKLMSIESNDENLKILDEERLKIEKLYYSYYIFDIDSIDLLKEINFPLETVLEEIKTKEINPIYILKSRILYIICRLFYIIDLNNIQTGTQEEQNVEIDEIIKNFTSNLFVLINYFIENNEYNSLILISHYYLQSLLRVPYDDVQKIFLIYTKCAKLIQEKIGVIDDISCFLDSLYQCIFNFKEKDNKKFKEISQNNLWDEFTIGNQTIFYFLTIIIKLILQTKVLHPLQSISHIKNLIFTFLQHFDFTKFHNQNQCLTLIIINRIFYSYEESDRETITKLIPIQKIIRILEKTEIEVDFRAELLIFLKKFRLSMSFIKKGKINKIRKFDYIALANEKKIDRKKTKRSIRINRKKSIKVNDIALNNDIVSCFQLNNEERTKFNNYINAFCQNNDEYFSYIKNNPWISNYNFPIKYLTFHYFFIKSDDTDKIFKLAEASIQLYEKELRIFKDLFERNSNNSEKILKYYIKGIILPICSMIKLMFCFTGNCTGTTSLMIYQVITKMLYIKLFIMDAFDSFIANKKIPHFENFNMEDFLKSDKKEEYILNYFELKEKNNFSPFDFTSLWKIFQEHFLNYIIYPINFELEDNFPFKTIDKATYGNISEETGIIDNLNLNFMKKRAHYLYKKEVKVKEKDLNITTTNDEDENNKENKNSKKSGNANLPSKNHMKSNVYNNILENKEHKNEIVKKLLEINEIYFSKKKAIDEENSSLLSALPEICKEYELNFRRILLGLLINLPDEGVGLKYIGSKILYKLLSITNLDTQNDICLNMNYKENKELGFLVNISNSLYNNIVTLFLNDFNYDFVSYKDIKESIYIELNILKLLCKNRNQYFKKNLLVYMNYSFTKFPEIKMASTNTSKFFLMDQDKGGGGGAEDSMSLVNLLINVLHKMLVISNKAHNKTHISFLYNIFNAITELLVEIIQGNNQELIFKDKQSTYKNNVTLYTFNNFVSLASEILLDNTLIEGHAFKTRLLLISFFIAILEEKNNEEINKCIMMSLTMNKVINSINFTMKNYFYEKTKDDIKYKDYYSNFTEKQISQREIIFDDTVFSFYKYNYFHSDLSKESKEFKLASDYYKYIKELSVREKSKEVIDLLKQTEKISIDDAKKKFELFNKKFKNATDITPINLINEKEKSISIIYIENYYILKFFEIITKVVEIRLPEEKRNVNVIFMIPCDIEYLTDITKEEFIYNANRENENTKKFELIKSISLFQLEIEYFKNSKLNFLTKLILSLNFNYIQIFMYLFATGFLIFMLLTLEGDIETRPEVVETPNERRRLLRFLIDIPEKISNAIDESINVWGATYNYICYCFCILNLVFIISWISVKMRLYYVLDKYKYKEENKIKNDKELTTLTKMRIVIFDTIIGRDYINSLLYMFIISLIGTIMNRGEIIYSFLLMSILNLNNSIRFIISSMKVKGPELLATFCLLILLVYFYSNIGFFYLNDNFAADIEDDISDNYCLYLSFCFMTNFDAGIRARGGAADQMVRLSFERNTQLYVIRLFYDITYFLICIILMIDLVFSIVIGTFSEMGEKQRAHDNDKVNHCFLCHIKREMLEKKKEDFQFHRENKHNLWNYVYYMLYLKFSDVKDLNSINSFVRTNLDNKNICFLPSYQDNYADNENEIKEESEGDVKSAEEESLEDESEEEEEEIEKDNQAEEMKI